MERVAKEDGVGESLSALSSLQGCDNYGSSSAIVGVHETENTILRASKPAGSIYSQWGRHPSTSRYKKRKTIVLPFPYQFPHQHLLNDGDNSILHEEGSLANEWMSKCLLVREPSVQVGVHRMIDRVRRGE